MVSKDLPLVWLEPKFVVLNETGSLQGEQKTPMSCPSTILLHGGWQCHSFALNIKLPSTHL